MGAGRGYGFGRRSNRSQAEVFSVGLDLKEAATISATQFIFGEKLV
jgi:hypothetical protein